MGIQAGGVQLLVRLWRNGSLRDLESVIEIGSQDVMVDPMAVVALLASVTGQAWTEGVAVTARRLYASLGLSEYQTIDADGRHGALVYDLNRDIGASYDYHDQFGLVTNFGTTEHVFDQRQAFANIHRLCRPGGLMLHALPCQGWLDHAPFAYQPCFFQDVASANGYELLSLDLSPPERPELTHYEEEAAKSLLAVPGVVDLTVMAVLRRTRADDFVVPYDTQFLGSSRIQTEYEQARTPEREIHYESMERIWSEHRDIASMGNRELLHEIARRLRRRFGR